MRHLLTSLALLATFAAAGQTANPFPYNPDADADGWISVNDLLSLLSIFTMEFTPESWETDSLSAAVVLNGNINYFGCQRACHQLEGHWRMADMDGFGKHWNLVAGENANHWVNSNSSLGSHDYNEFFEINGYGSVYSVSSPDLSLGKKCMCHLQSSPFVPDVLTTENAGLQDQIDSIEVELNELEQMIAVLDSVQLSILDSTSGIPCEYVDLCGVCEGPGAVYECGCSELEAWACDCEGNQLDALGVCGGGCIGDYDGDGECDQYISGACSNMDYVEFYGFAYDVVEIGGRCWFQQDLRTEFYRNGDSIPHAQEAEDWIESSDSYTGAWSVQSGYEYNGYIYNWYTVIDERGMCPLGWHVPSRSEYIALGDSLAAELPVSSSCMFGSITDVLLDNEVTSGSNDSGYSATFTGQRTASGNFALGTSYYGWTQSYSTSPESWFFYLTNGNIGNCNISLATMYGHLLVDAVRSSGLAVRCIKDQ